jgi:hydroxymethylpyrimidine pyrophosphatase-like HAD family hydrolase
MSKSRNISNYSSCASDQMFHGQELSEAPYKIMQYRSYPLLKSIVLDKSSLESDLQPAGILCLDIDNTLLDYTMTSKSNVTTLINPEKIKALLKKAKENNFIVMVVTARPLEDPYNLTHSYDAMNVVNALGMEYFNTLFFTHYKSKHDVLHLLNAIYFNSDPTSLRKIALVDDTLDMLDTCEAAGFTIINAKHSDYLNKISNFLENKKSMLEKDSKNISLVEVKPDYFKKLPGEVLSRHLFKFFHWDDKDTINLCQTSKSLNKLRMT